MNPQQLPPDSNQPPAEDHLLEDLAALTGLFNPELIWQKEEQLDNLEEAARKAAEPTEPEY